MNTPLTTRAARTALAFLALTLLSACEKTIHEARAPHAPHPTASVAVAQR